MNIQNIDRFLLFKNDGKDRVMTLEQLTERYGFEPDGTNYYYGINAANLASFEATTSALSPSHRAFFDALLNSTKASADREKTLVLGLEPLEPRVPYRFVAANLELVRQLAVELAAVQQSALDAGKRLDILIRYASEMNDGGQAHGNDPNGYTSTFVQVRRAFAAAAPAILFSFSPALRADLAERAIAQYWPGDENVDIIGGTWYIGAAGQRSASIANMRAYFIHRLGAGKPFALSELGGADASGAGNDAVLADMLHELAVLQRQSVALEYVTFFLEGKWGTDATLSFLNPHDALIASS